MSEQAHKASTESPPAGLPQCACGHTREDVGKVLHVEAQGEWSPWGWILLLLGITAIPKKVKFVCKKCGQLIEVSTDPDVCKNHI